MRGPEYGTGNAQAGVDAFTGVVDHAGAHHLEQRVADHARVDAEVALSGANEKFTTRFHKLEERIETLGKKLDGMSLAEMDVVWDEVKKRE